jgi:hypothetical protein
VTMRDQFAHRRGNKADPAFVVFDFLRNTDLSWTNSTAVFSSCCNTMAP